MFDNRKQDVQHGPSAGTTGTTGGGSGNNEEPLSELVAPATGPTREDYLKENSAAQKMEQMTPLQQAQTENAQQLQRPTVSEMQARQKQADDVRQEAAQQHTHKQNH